MGCVTDGKGLWVCGVRNRRDGYYFDEERRAVWYDDCLYYGPSLVLRREKGEHFKTFVRRVKEKLKFMPMTYRGWWQRVAVPELRASASRGRKTKHPG